MWRWLMLSAAAVALVVVAGLLLAWLLLSPSRIDREHFEALRVGMMRQEAERALGGPPRNECPGAVDVWARRQGKLVSAELDPEGPAVPFFPDAGPADGDREIVWVSEAGLIAVRLGDDGRVREKYFSTVHGPDRSLLGKVLPRARR